MGPAIDVIHGFIKGVIRAAFIKHGAVLGLSQRDRHHHRFKNRTRFKNASDNIIGVQLPFDKGFFYYSDLS